MVHTLSFHLVLMDDYIELMVIDLGPKGDIWFNTSHDR